MPTTRKTIAVRLPDDQFAIISRLCELTGKSRNAFFQEIMDQATPALSQMLQVLDEAERYRNPAERVGKVVSIGAEETSRVLALIQGAGVSSEETH